MSGEKNMLSSKDILLKTNISRATLNNYIRMGILPRPIVRAPLDGIKGPKKIGYFPGHVLNIIEKVRHLKNEGFSMEVIAEKMKPPEPTRPLSDSVETRKAMKTRKGIPGTLTLFPEMEPSVPVTIAKQKIKAVGLHWVHHVLPSLLSLCVLHASLEPLNVLSDEMPPEDYCAFLNKVWKEFETICVRHGGLCQYGNLFIAVFLGGEKTTCLKNALNAGIEVRDLSHRIHALLTRGRSVTKYIHLNVGLGFGEEYCAMVKGFPGRIITPAGRAASEARMLSAYARGGTLWASKNLLCRLNLEERRNYRFGIRQGEDFIEHTFVRIQNVPTGPERDEPSSLSDIIAAEIL